MGDISPSCIACEMISAMLPNLLWASTIMALCFPCFAVWPLENFRVATVKREKTTPNPGIEDPPAITAEVVKPVSMISMIVFHRFSFFASRLHSSISSRKNASISVNFLIDMFVVLVVLKGLNQGKCGFHCRIYSLFI